MFFRNNSSTGLYLRSVCICVVMCACLRCYVSEYMCVSVFVTWFFIFSVLASLKKVSIYLRLKAIHRRI